jgi:lactoylglutathione lyase
MDVKIAHAAVYAVDLEKTKDFYVKYFGGKCGGIYRNKSGFSSYFISFSGGARLEVTHSANLQKRAYAEYGSGFSHIAFSVGSREAVLHTTKSITDGGYPLYSAPRLTGDGYFESCVGDPDGNRVEITV